MTDKNKKDIKNSDMLSTQHISEADLKNLDVVFTLAIQNLANSGNKKQEIGEILNLQNRVFTTLNEVNKLNQIEDS